MGNWTRFCSGLVGSFSASVQSDMDYRNIGHMQRGAFVSSRDRVFVFAERR